MKKHLIRLFSLTLALTLILSGCISDSGNPADPRDSASDPSAYSADSTAEAETALPESEETAETEEETTQPDVPDIPQMGTLTQLRDYLKSNIEQDNFDLTFLYTDEENPDFNDISWMVNAFPKGTYRKTKDGHTLYNIEIIEYPGNRVADAYFSGDVSGLSADEESVLNKAVQIVNEAKATTAGVYELELYLHDYLAETVTYEDADYDDTDPMNLSRHITAIGALLDGSANCQGYTDGFYTLAAIAGFQVGRMCAVDDEGMGHMFNTINLDGKWYVVDVTFDDTVFYDTWSGAEENITNYRLFNAGEDMCDEYSWEDTWEYHPIAEESDHNYYYNNGDGKAFYDLYTMADSIVTRWLNGQTWFQTVLIGTSDPGDGLSSTLQARLDATGVGYSYAISPTPTDDNTFYTVECYYN